MTNDDMPVPVSCPFCEWVGSVDEVEKVTYDRKADSGVIVQGKIKWLCPECGVWIKDEDYDE